MKLSRLNDLGQKQFSALIAAMRADANTPIPRLILESPEYSEIVLASSEMANETFATRFEIARYLNALLSEADVSQPEVDVGLWAWLALYYFDQLCPVGEKGRKIGESARYIYALGDYKKRYRHLLLGPYLVYRAHIERPEAVKAFLANPIHNPGDIAEQLASRQELVVNPVVMELATCLYYDHDSGRLKLGAGGRGGGSPRRLADFLNQIDLTYDLTCLGTSQLLSMLPVEFRRFLPPTKVPVSDSR